MLQRVTLFFWGEGGGGQEWSQQMDKLQKLKTSFICCFGFENLSILLQIYTFTCNFCSRKGGCASIG